MKRKINVVTLGCAKNRVDSEHLMAQLRHDRFEVVYDSDSTDAKIVVVNTCGFIGDAKQESIDTILSFVAAKNRGEIERLFVMGCLSERYKEELRPEIPEVDDYFGVRDMADVVAAVGGQWREHLAGERMLTTPRHYAYLKISEGCDRRCGYCAIPLIRGRHVSVPMDALVAEAEKLAAGGTRELIVIAQDTTYYGLRACTGERKLELLRRLCRIDGIEWIRLHYAYPLRSRRTRSTRCATSRRYASPSTSLSSISATSQLRSMRRGIDRAQTYALIDRLRSEIPGIALRTTLLTGYPDGKRGRLRQARWSSSGRSVSSGWAFSPTREEGPIRRSACRTTYPKRPKGCASSGSWNSRTASPANSTCSVSARPNA